MMTKLLIFNNNKGLLFYNRMTEIYIEGLHYIDSGRSMDKSDALGKCSITYYEMNAVNKRRPVGIVLHIDAKDIEFHETNIEVYYKNLNKQVEEFIEACK